MSKGNSAEQWAASSTGNAESKGRSSFANQTEATGQSRFDRSAYDYADENYRKSANLVQPETTVDDELGTGNIAGILRQKESCSQRHFLRRAHPLQ